MSVGIHEREWESVILGRLASHPIHWKHSVERNPCLQVQPSACSAAEETDQSPDLVGPRSPILSDEMLIKLSFFEMDKFRPVPYINFDGQRLLGCA